MEKGRAFKADEKVASDIMKGCGVRAYKIIIRCKNNQKARRY